uniref:Uncharacterized protein n=1 Tax=Glossina austeni TaxID=7395 RepID=A0A1A9V5B5_GLOAU
MKLSVRHCQHQVLIVSLVTIICSNGKAHTESEKKYFSMIYHEISSSSDKRNYKSILHKEQPKFIKGTLNNFRSNNIKNPLKFTNSNDNNVDLVANGFNPKLGINDTNN